ncbi:MAG: hypothetical protein HGA22_02115 [Clostridiales bacterium]|nr:hypothetical protein [Clostridiales bacterium]
MSIFEILMLVCFGAAWPLSIYKSYTSRKNTGKSVGFLFVIVAGYIFGILHKIFFSYNAVIFLYILNCIMVSTDICLFYRNESIMKKEMEAGV